MWRYSSAAFLVFILTSCLTYYEKNLVFHEEFARRDYGKANEILDKNKYIQREKNRLLYLLDKGVTLQMMGSYEESNKFFEEAYIYCEDFEQSMGGAALSLVTNDMALRYGGEDFEKVFIHYYKAINYIMMEQLDEAMVECRRINIRLNEINDKYKSENKYKRDAFAHVLMGLLYEAKGNSNDAFIAYRNAFEIYEEDYVRFFGLGAPSQLKKDLIRTAALNGFQEDLDLYEKKFNMKYDASWKRQREMVYLWHNGLGPVKDEWSINFIVMQGTGGYVSFVNKELGLDFAFYVPSKDQSASLSNLRVVRVAFPKYSARKLILTGAAVRDGEKEYKMEMLEDFNQIAVKSLRDRMVRELSKTLLRTALKQAAAYAARQENQDLGAAVMILNAATEKADTRNWQTLPAQIFYTRIPVDSAVSSLELTTFRGEHRMSADVRDAQFKGRIGFRFFHSIDRESLL